MVSPIFNQDGRIKFEPESHTYWDGDTQLKSVSSMLNLITEPFDSKKISGFVAQSEAKKTGGNVEEIQMKTLEEWEEKRKSAEDRGNFIHDNLESYVLKGKYSPKLQGVVEQIAPIIREGYRTYPEALLYSIEDGTAGLTDLAIQRQRSENSVYDFWDYKTNESKGIVFDSIDRKKDPMKHYNRYFLSPFSHLEDCNYNRYALQLSCYAYMAMKTWNIKVGKLGILFVDLKMIVHPIPVPFMALEAEKLLGLSKTLKKLPSVKKENSSYEYKILDTKHGFVPEGDDNDW